MLPALLPLQLLQMYTDPDDIFQQHQKTCTLDEVFAHRGECAHSGLAAAMGSWIAAAGRQRTGPVNTHPMLLGFSASKQQCSNIALLGVVSKAHKLRCKRLCFTWLLS